LTSKCADLPKHLIKYGGVRCSNRKAAILLPLCNINSQASCIFTIRSQNLPSHAGQVCFPGGHFDENLDENLEETAIRECHEELGEKLPIEIIGRMSDVFSIHGVCVTPYIGYIRDDNIIPEALPFNHDEVEQVFSLTLDHLVDDENRILEERGNMKLPAFIGGPQKIWGLTAFVLNDFLSRVYTPVQVDAAALALKKHSHGK
jgi:nudix motif 8